MAAWSQIYTFVAGQVPTATNWNANPSSLSTLLSGALDKDNVDSTSADGIGVLNVNQTRTGTSTFTGAVLASTTLTVGVNDTGHDVKFFGASSGAFMEWDESADELEIRGATAAGPGKLLLSTGELTNVDTGILGRIDFQAPLDSAGTDAILVAASIWAEADATFSSSVNTTDLVFAAATSEAAAAVMRMKKESLSPNTTNGMSLGTTALNWSDLYLDSGGVINFDSGNVTVTHSSGTLTVAGNIAATDLDGIIGSNTAAAGTFTTVNFSSSVVAANAAGPSVLNEAATATNPTLVPNKAELDTGIGWAASDSVSVITGGTERMRVDSAGNVGIGVTPAATWSDRTVLQIGGNLTLLAKTAQAAGNQTVLAQNTSFDTSADWIYQSTDEASYYDQRNGCHFWYTAPSGTAGNDITFTERMSIDEAGIIFTGAETANANMSGGGLTLDQNAADNEILAFKSSDVTHGVTNYAETDTYAEFRKFSSADGGLQLRPFTQGATGFRLWSTTTTESTTKSSGATGNVAILAVLKSGTSIADHGADANLLVVGTNSAPSRFIFDVEGSGHADVAWTTYDKHDDIQLVRDMEEELLLHEDDAKTDRRHALEAVGVIGKDSWHMENGKPRAMVNFTKLSMLHHGAMIQLYDKLETVTGRLQLAESKLAMLEA